MIIFSGIYLGWVNYSLWYSIDFYKETSIKFSQVMFTLVTGYMIVKQNVKSIRLFFVFMSKQKNRTICLIISK